MPAFQPRVPGRPFGPLGTQPTLLVLLLACMLSLGSQAQPNGATLTLRDGQVLSGEVTWREDRWEILAEGQQPKTVALDELARFQAPQSPPDPSKSPHPAEGLLGQYFSGPDFGGQEVTRVDPSINFSWAGRVPAPGIPPVGFSVRWTGKVRPVFTEHHSFSVESSGATRLFVNRGLILDKRLPAPGKQQAIAVFLTAGTEYEIRLEFVHSAGEASVKLSWAGPSQKPEIVPSAHLIPAERRRLLWPSGVWLVDGSFWGRPLVSADRSSVLTEGLSPDSPRRFLRSEVARLILQPLFEPIEDHIPMSRPGLLLRNKDFADAEFLGLHRTAVQVNSILLGKKTYESVDVLAVILKDLPALSAGWKIRLMDTTTLWLPRIEFRGGRIHVPSGSLQGESFGAQQILEINSISEEPSH